MFAAFLTLLTVASAVIPLSTYIWVLYICAFCIGVGNSVFSCTVNVWTIELWRGTRFPIIQVHEVAFGIGSILATQTLKPYLIGELPDESPAPSSNYSLASGLSAEVLVIDETAVIDRRSRLMIPTLMIGACIIICTYFCI